LKTGCFAHKHPDSCNLWKDHLPIFRWIGDRHWLKELTSRSQGSALFADISGFTPLTEGLVRDLGPQRGAEELTHYLNLIYDALIAELHRFGGSVINFSGDAITCWLNDDMGLRGVACALSMQQVMRLFTHLRTPSGKQVSIAVKAAVTGGEVSRYVVGNPDIQLIDVLAGETLNVEPAGADRAPGRER
jgi:class 3 adenylate cyclase